MAYQNKEIVNQKTGQIIKFLKTAQDSAGKRLEMESTIPPTSEEPPPHYHPLQDEKFIVLKGQVSVRIDGDVKIMKEGDSFEVRRATVHSMWNHTKEQAILNWRVEPALNTEFFFETAFGIANEQRTDSKGMPHLLQIALLANRFSLVFRLAKPAYGWQSVIFLLLSPVAFLCGFRSYYPKYIN